MDLSLKSKPSCHTLSNAFDISKKTDLTSRVGLQSNASNISCAIAGKLIYARVRWTKARLIRI